MFPVSSGGSTKVTTGGEHISRLAAKRSWFLGESCCEGSWGGEGGQFFGCL